VGLNDAIGPVPVPLSVTTWVEPGTFNALSVTVTLADNVPTSVGENVTEIVQLANAARVAVQVVDSVKSPRFVPPRLITAMLSGPLPPLVRVAVWTAEELPALVFGKVSALTESVACGMVTTATAVPVRVRETFGVDVLSVAVMVSVSAPAACGVNAKTRVQLAFAAKDAFAAHVLAEVSVKDVVAPDSV